MYKIYYFIITTLLGTGIHLEQQTGKYPNLGLFVNKTFDELDSGFIQNRDFSYKMIESRPGFCNGISLLNSEVRISVFFSGNIQVFNNDMRAEIKNGQFELIKNCTTHRIEFYDLDLGIVLQIYE